MCDPGSALTAKTLPARDALLLAAFAWLVTQSTGFG
jgi:hypothetical protein